MEHAPKYLIYSQLFVFKYINDFLSRFSNQNIDL